MNHPSPLTLLRSGPLRPREESEADPASLQK